MTSGVVELLSGDLRRRRWSSELKERIVSETLEPGVTVTDVARRHGVDRSLVYRWRRQLKVERVPEPGGFLPVTVRKKPGEAAPASCSCPARPAETIEILLPDGVCIRTGPSVAGEALSRVLRALGR